MLVSKVGAARGAGGEWLEAQRPEELRAGVEANLRGLELDQVPVVNLRRHPRPDVPFEEQVDAMIELRDEGLIGGIGLSTVTLEQYRLAAAAQSPASRTPSTSSTEATRRCSTSAPRTASPTSPIFPLGSAFSRSNPVLGSPVVAEAALRLGATAAQVALAWLLAQAPTVLLIPGTSSLAHLEENLAVAELELDDAALEALG